MNKLAADEQIAAAEGALVGELGRVDTRRLRARARADEQAAERPRGLAGEALAALPEETRRLERLASVAAEELPELAQALRAT